MNIFFLDFETTGLSPYTNDIIEIAVKKLNDDKNVHGILLQHPVPSQIDERLCFDAIDIKKRCRWCYLFGFWKYEHGN